MRTPYMPWHQFFEELKKLPPEQPFTLGLSGESSVAANETRAPAPKEIRSVPPRFRIRKDPESLNDLRAHNATGTRAQEPQPQLPRTIDPSPSSAASRRSS